MPYIWSLDRISIAVAISGVAVRLGNLMNSEIYGTVTSLPWGFIFVRDGETLPKHPTQIYEALCYLVLFIILWWMYYKKDTARRRPGLMFGFFLIVLFGTRFLIEFIKNPQGRLRSEYAPEYGTAVKYSVYPDRYRDPLVRIAQTSARSRTAEKRVFPAPLRNEK